MKEALKILMSRQGEYSGEGINHGNQRFQGTLRVSPLANGSGCALEYRAVGESGAVYHEERSVLGPSADGSPSLWVASSNHPMVFEHRFAGLSPKANTDTLAFRLGDIENRDSFRELIEIELWKNGDLSYRYSWGMPGADFDFRSGARMTRSAAGTLEAWHLAIPVHELERSLAFYVDALGFTLTKRDEYEKKKQAFVAVRAGGFTLELFEPKGEAAEKPRRLPDHVAFECADLAAFRERALAKGVAGVEAIEVFDNGVKYLSLSDPDGVRLDFFEGRAKYEST